MKTKITARTLMAVAFFAYGLMLGLWLFRRLYPKRPAVLRVIRVEPDAFSDIQDVAEAAVEIAKRNLAVVVFDFNGVELRARPDSTVEGLVRFYRIAASEARAAAAYEQGKNDAQADAAARVLEPAPAPAA